MFLPGKRNSLVFPTQLANHDSPLGVLDATLGDSCAGAVGVPWGAVLLQRPEPWGAGRWSPTGPCSCINGPGRGSVGPEDT